MGQSISDRNGLSGLFTSSDDEDDIEEVSADFDEDEFLNFDDMSMDSDDNDNA